MAAGLGTRMRSRTPKHLHRLLGRRVVDWVLDAARPLAPAPLVVVSSELARDEFEGVQVAVQERPRGTADAVASARVALAGFDGDVLVLSGDAPLLTTELLGDLVDAHRREDSAVTILSFESARPLPYGRLLRDEAGGVRAIVEATDATPEQLETTELNSSIYVFTAQALWPALEAIASENAQGERYLTDAVASIVEVGGRAAAFVSPDAEAPVGVNTRPELAAAGAVLRDRINERHMLAGVTIVDPATTWIEPGVRLEADAVVHPFTVLRGGTTVESGAEIGPHAVLVDAAVGMDATVGPFCYLRPGTVLGAGAKAGTFVELKNTQIGVRTKVPHLSYLGDAEIGDDTNVAAGNVTVNFPHQPGRPKGRTRIGNNVRTGVDNSFVAPVTVEDDVWIAAGTVVTDDVPAGSLAGFPPRQVTREGYVYERRQPDD